MLKIIESNKLKRSLETIFVYDNLTGKVTKDIPVTKIFNNNRYYLYNSAYNQPISPLLARFIISLKDKRKEDIAFVLTSLQDDRIMMINHNCSNFQNVKGNSIKFLYEGDYYQEHLEYGIILDFYSYFYQVPI